MAIMDEVKSLSMKKKDGKPIIWIIDSQQWPRAYLGALLIERGFDVLGFMELDRAVTALRDPHYARPRLIVLELKDLSVTGDQLETLLHLSIPIVGLTGTTEINNEKIKGMKWAALIRRPVTIGRVADLIEALLRS